MFYVQLKMYYSDSQTSFKFWVILFVRFDDRLLQFAKIYFAMGLDLRSLEHVWENLNWWQDSFPLILVSTFLLFLYHVLVHQPFMFVKKHGRKHSLTGLFYLVWLSWGYLDLLLPRNQLMLIPNILYDIVLGTTGVSLTLLAAHEFQHKNVKNFASGTLDVHATVTYEEMLEHSFYQGINLIQIIFLHLFCMQMNLSIVHRLLLLLIVTLPWYFRSYFPINRFSDNYSQIDHQSTALVRFLYRIKKYQYVFYKHFILHGLNITVAVNSSPLASKRHFRLFWLLLNTSYVMEFFLQTLVKKRYMTQETMLALQKVLMLASTIAAANVLTEVNWLVCIISLALNFLHRKHDLLNTMIVAVGYIVVLVIVFEQKDLLQWDVNSMSTS